MAETPKGVAKGETMKPYGISRKDSSRCCPGHDKFPSETYSNRRSKKAQTRDTKIAHRMARARAKAEIMAEINNLRRGRR